MFVAEMAVNRSCQSHFCFKYLCLYLNINLCVYFSDLDPDINPDEEEEKQRLITQVLELQNTLDGLFYLVINNLKCYTSLRHMETLMSC